MENNQEIKKFDNLYICATILTMNKELMTVDCYDCDFPRISIYINGQHVGNINHLVQTEEQIKNNKTYTIL